MVVWSSVKNAIPTFINNSKYVSNQALFRRWMSGGHDRVMHIKPSNWQWKKCKDLLHFYFLLGAIPVAALVFYVNVFIGPAQLEPIPEGYVPKHWEYYRHPITRFMARYLFTSPQQEYEKYLHQLYEEDEKMKINILANKVKDLMDERKDMRSFYFYNFDGKYYRRAREMAEKDMTGGEIDVDELRRHMAP